MIPTPTGPRHLVAVFGGAVAGSEAARVLAEAGVACVVFEQNPRPYGKIEDGLPRWHDKQRLKEYGKIDERLDREPIEFVPLTVLGRDLDFRELYESWGFSGILLATGAWNDRSLEVEGVDQFVDRGLVYQNPLVGWFNHYHEPGFDGQQYEIPDGAVVIGGGLASIDVVKICMLETVGRALREQKGIDVPMIEMEHKGINTVLEGQGLTLADLGLAGCLLIYRRRSVDMPLASAPPDADAARIKKVEQTRQKLLDNCLEKYLVRFQDRTLPQGAIVEDGALVGLRCCRTEVQGRNAIPLEGTQFELFAPLFISSIGSIPRPIDGIEMKGVYYKYKDWETGELDGLDAVWGVGNTVTGQGNIRVSLKHGQFVGQHVAEYLGVGAGPLDADDLMAGAEKGAAARAGAVAEAVKSKPPLSVEAQQSILARVRARQQELGYESYASWIERHATIDQREAQQG